MTCATQVLTNFDIWAAAGGRYVAHDRTFTTTVSGGTLTIAFTAVSDSPNITAIEIVPEAAPPADPPLATYSYRGDNLRESKTVGASTTTYTWDVNASLPVVLQDGTYSYVYGHGLISQTDSAGTQSYMLSDGLGSTRALTDATGTVTATYAYDVFGALRASTGTASTEYRFTGQQDDPTIGMQYLRARYYDPGVGRFISKDPAPGRRAAPISYHSYQYGYNDPVNLHDPSGQFPWLLAAGVAWSVYEVGSSVLDAYSTGSTLVDPCAGIEEKVVSSGLFVLGLWAPGGGYSTTARGLVNVEQHHLLPRQFVNEFRRAGLDIEQFVTHLPADLHRLKPSGLHTGPDNWNAQWKQFFEAHQNPRAEDVLQQLARMKKQFGLE